MIRYPGLDNPMMASHCGKSYTITAFPGYGDYERIFSYWAKKYSSIPWWRFKKKKALRDYVKRNIWP